MYFDDAKIAFYIVPKAACTSIQRLLGTLYMQDGDITWKPALRRLREGGYREGYFRIAVCRNPWERARSLYTEKMLDSPMVKPRVANLGFYTNMPFSEFAKLLVRIEDSNNLDKHFKSQYLTIFRDGPPHFLARVETLEKDWLKIQQLFRERGGEKEIPELWRLRVTQSEKPRWTRKIKNAIANRYAKDIELLGYRK